MAITQQIINVGASPNDGAGDPLRTAFIKTNENFTVLFNIGGVSGIANGTSNISIPFANSNIEFSVGNVSNVFKVLANGAITTGNHAVTSYLNAGNVTTSGTILANGTIQSLGGVTAVTVTAAGNLVGGNLNVTNQMRASTLLLTGNIINAELNVTGNINAGNINSTGNLIGLGSKVSVNGFVADSGAITATGQIFTMNGFSVQNGNVAASGSNLSISGFSAVAGNISASGNILTISNFSVANGVINTGGGITANGAASFNGNATVTGNVQGLYFIGNGSQLTGVTAAPANIFNIVNVNNGANLIIADSPNDTLSFTQGNNITLIGNTTTDTVFVSVNDNPNFPGFVTAVGFIGDIKGSVFADDSTIMVDAVDNKLFASGANIAGNVYADLFVGNVQGNIVGNLSVLGANTGIVFNDNGSANAVAGLTYNKVTDTLATTGTMSASGNVQGTYILGNGSLLTGVITSVEQIISGNTNLRILSPGGNLSANINGVANVLSITTSAINYTGKITATGNVTAPYFIGNVLGNISGNLTVAGGNTQVVFNDSGIANATSGFTFDKSTNAVSTSGTITATGNISGGNIVSTGLLTTTSNVNGGNVIATANVQGGNLVSTGIVTSTGNVIAPYFIGNVIGNISGNLTVGGANTQVVFNDNGVANATAGFTFNKSTNAVSTTGTITATGNIVGGNIITSALVSAATLSTTGNATLANIISAGTLSINSGNAATAIINAAGNGTGNIGSASAVFNTVYAKATSAVYADLAEAYLADFDYVPGTVVSIGGTQEITMSIIDSDTKAIGVISTNPAFKMNDALTGQYPLQVALVGRVPAYVNGPVRRGEMMVSAGNGRLRSELNPKVGSVLGRALEDFDGESGVIEVLIGRN